MRRSSEMVLVSPWAVVTKVTWMGTFFSPSEAPAIPLIKMLAWTLPVADWTDITAVAAPLLESGKNREIDKFSNAIHT